ncbi:hypothetical protein XENOCAPTIV_005734, partial [Xenoophorus captivus]
DVHVDICWRRLEGHNMCAEPIQERRTTYTECCCLYGVAWSGQCALCPRKDSGEQQDAHRTSKAQIFLHTGITMVVAVLKVFPCLPTATTTFRNHPFVSLSYDQAGTSPNHWIPMQRFDSFEGLRAEECGILNGCENGRCVRVREGYTCDCFDGYELNMDKMACIDINECEDISDKVPLCQNGQCTNTEGSYKCTCLPGFVASAKPHKCIPAIPEPTLRVAEN